MIVFRAFKVPGKCACMSECMRMWVSEWVHATLSPYMNIHRVFNQTQAIISMQKVSIARSKKLINAHWSRLVNGQKGAHSGAFLRFVPLSARFLSQQKSIAWPHLVTETVNKQLPPKLHRRTLRRLNDAFVCSPFLTKECRSTDAKRRGKGKQN